MTERIDWSLLLLKDNPFRVSPPDNPREVHWAGMPELRREFEQILSEARHSSATQVVLNRGPFGGGKTHASLFFSLEENWPPAGDRCTRGVQVITVPTPKETGKADQDFYVDVLERLGMKTIRLAIASGLSEVGSQRALEILQEVTGSEGLGQAIWLLGTDDYPEHARLLDAYFLDKCTRSELRTLGLARGIDKAQDRFRVLAGILRCLIGLEPGHDVTKHMRICLWIDEMEDLVYFTSAQYRPFVQGLRDLIDRLPDFFSLFMNFTLTTPEELGEIEVILGKALVDRITDHIIFREITPDQSLRYVQELLACWRTEDPTARGLSPLYPFEEDALRFLVEGLDGRTPRSVNKRCRNATLAALRSGRFPRSGEGIIDLEFVKAMSQDELDREIL